MLAAAKAKQSNGSAVADAEQIVERALPTLTPRDLRNRAEMLLLKVRILQAKHDSAGALSTWNDYAQIGYLVESGRVRELSADVRAELFPTIPPLRCPADQDEPDYGLKANERAARQHAVLKVRALDIPKVEKARKLGVSRQHFDRLEEEFETAAVPERPKSERP